MASRQTSAPSCLRTNYKSGTATYGVSTLDDEAAGRRVCMSVLPKETRTDDILNFFEPGTVEGITIRYHSGFGTIAFVQFSRPSDFTDALLKNEQSFLGTRAKIRPYKKGEHPSPQSKAKRREQSNSMTMNGNSLKRSPPSRTRNQAPTREVPPSSSHRNRSRSPDTGRSPTGPRAYRSVARSPPPRRRSRSRSPSVRSHTRTRSPERSTHSERSNRYSHSRRSPERARSRSNSADRDRHKRNRDRSPSLDRNFSRRPDPFLPNDAPNPSAEMLVRQSMALWKHQPQVVAKMPMAHVFGANSAPMPNLPGTSMTQAIAYTTQASQSSYVAQSNGTGVGGGLFNGNLERIFSEQGPGRVQQLQTTSNGVVVGGGAAASEMPAGVEFILKFILEYKSARNLSIFQLDSVVDYLQKEKRMIQQASAAAGDQSANVRAIEAPSAAVAVDAAGDIGSSDDLRNRLNQQQSDDNLMELARKIQKYATHVKEEKD